MRCGEQRAESREVGVLQRRDSVADALVLRHHVARAFPQRLRQLVDPRGGAADLAQRRNAEHVARARAFVAPFRVASAAMLVADAGVDDFDRERGRHGDG